MDKRTTNIVMLLAVCAGVALARTKMGNQRHRDVRGTLAGK